LRNLLLADDAIVFVCMSLHARAHVCIIIWMFHFIFDSQISQKYGKMVQFEKRQIMIKLVRKNHS